MGADVTRPRIHISPRGVDRGRRVWRIGGVRGGSFDKCAPTVLQRAGRRQRGDRRGDGKNDAPIERNTAHSGSLCDNGAAPMSVAIGIDLGTTNTVIAAVRNGRAVTLGDDNGEKLLPSIVSFHPSKTVLVGQPARDRRLVDPENTIYSVKRLIGRNWSTQEVAAGADALPLRSRTRGEGERPRSRARRDLCAPRDQRVRAPSRQSDRRKSARRGGHARGHHGAGELQRSAARVDEGRRQARGARSASHLERADGGGACVWTNDGALGTHRHLRPWRRYI